MSYYQYLKENHIDKKLKVHQMEVYNSLIHSTKFDQAEFIN